MARKQRSTVDETTFYRCGVCGRSRLAREFIQSTQTETGVEPRCRTCKAVKGKEMLDTETLEVYEKTISDLTAASTIRLTTNYPDVKIDSDEQLLEFIGRHRNEFEQIFVVAALRHPEFDSFSFPCWLNERACDPDL